MSYYAQEWEILRHVLGFVTEVFDYQNGLTYYIFMIICNTKGTLTSKHKFSEELFNEINTRMYSADAIYCDDDNMFFAILFDYFENLLFPRSLLQ